MLKVRDNNIDEVSRVENDLKIYEINEDKYQNDDNAFEKFCDNYCNDNFNKEFNECSFDELCEKYEELNYYITMYNLECKDGKYNNTLVNKMQFILSKIGYSKAAKETENTLLEINKVKKDIESTYTQITTIDNKSVKTLEDVEDLKKEMKSIITVLISVIITISIIPTALAGIERIETNYIIPFVSSIIMFGMIMIVFLYSIYLDKVKILTLLILLIVMLTTIGFWYFSYNVSIEKDEVNNITSSFYCNTIFPSV